MEGTAERRVERGRIETRGELEAPGAILGAVTALGELAEAGADAAAGRLGEIASPAALDVLFRVSLGTSLRRGPTASQEVADPGRLVELAATAARAGALPVATVSELRSTLRDLAAEARSVGAWAREAPLWWSPLPAPDRLEELWLDLAGGPGRGPAVGVPPAEAVREAFSQEREGAAAGWFAWPGALPPPLLGRLHDELSGVAAAGALPLLAAGIGRADRLSRRRNDEVRYLTGLEGELLAGAPTLALLVQHLLERLEGALRRLLPGLEIHAPQTAMLARYRAPNPGFAAHLDNPGGEDDNGRALSLVLYLNPPDHPCRGGGLALWPRGAPGGGRPSVVLPPAGGSAVLFDARAVPHAVEPLAPGPDRWTLVLWLNDRARRPSRPLVPVPAVGVSEMLRAVDHPPVAPGSVLFRRVDGDPRSAPVVVRPPRGSRRPRAGLVATVRGVGRDLEGWCRHHLDLGFDRAFLVLDRGAGAEEAAELEGVRRALGPERLELWGEDEAERRRRSVPSFDGRQELLAAAEHGPATWAVAARQALHATAVLHRVRSGAAGNDRLDWLVHLDADELLVLEGPARGGATLAEHFAAAEAAGWRSVRYLDHELLLPWRPGEPLRFKRNPALAVERLGPVGWRRLVRHLGMEQDGPRPYFRAYWNGKGAAAVSAASHAAGVHGWHLPAAPEEPFLAGPSILHVHLPTAADFRRKYLLAAEAGERSGDPPRPFPPSYLERAACGLIRELRGSGAAAVTVARRLDALYEESTCFTPEEVELLEEAGLLFTPDLSGFDLTASAAPAGAAREA